MLETGTNVFSLQSTSGDGGMLNDTFSDVVHAMVLL